MALNSTSPSWGKTGARPISPKAQAAAARSRAKEADSPPARITEAEDPPATSYAANLTKGFVARQYELLYSVEPILDYNSCYAALEDGKPFRVGAAKDDAPLIDKWNIPSGTTVLLAFGRKYSLQKSYKVER